MQEPGPSTARAPDRGARRRAKHYVGDDRRAAPTPIRAIHFVSVAAVSGCLLALWLVVLNADLHQVVLPAGMDGTGLAQLLDTAVAAVAALAGLLAVQRFRVIGDATSMWTGLGAILFGVGAVGVGHLAPVVYPDAPADFPGYLLRPAAAVVAILVLAWAAAGPTVDTRLRFPLVLVGVLGVTGGAMTLLAKNPGLRDVTLSRDAHIVFASAWMGIASAHLLTAVRRARIQHLAVGIAAFGLALAELSLLFGEPTQVVGVDGSIPLIGAACLRLAAVTVLFVGGSRDLERAFCNQRGRLFEREVAAETESARRRAERAAQEERAHDAKNALLAIEGAATTLERYRDRLGPDQREALTEAVSEEIARLQRLIAAEREPEDLRAFDLAQLIGPIATTERVRGLQITTEIPEGLAAYGRPADTAEVVRNLLDNARRYAAGSPVHIRATVDAGWVVLYVEDRGRGIDRTERQAIFERGHRGSTSEGTDGSGIGLFVSRKLMLEQGGDMWAESRSGGGASFGLCLPPSAERAAEQPASPTPTTPEPRRDARRGPREAISVGGPRS